MTTFIGTKPTWIGNAVVTSGDEISDTETQRLLKKLIFRIDLLLATVDRNYTPPDSEYEE